MKTTTMLCDVCMSTKTIVHAKENTGFTEIIIAKEGAIVNEHWDVCPECYAEIRATMDKLGRKAEIHTLAEEERNGENG